MSTIKPWISGPKELLDHGLEHLKCNSDFDRRMALICIDNSIELMIKTFLSLPKRVTGIKIPRKQLDEVFMSFPLLLDSLEEFAEDRLDGIDLSDVEWYHRLRNELYHGGNGLTVEKQKVEVYAQLALKLHRNLFYGTELTPEEQSLIGRFINAWAEFEKIINNYTQRVAPKTSHGFSSEQVMSAWYKQDYEEVRNFRNNLVHGTVLQDAEKIKNMTEKIEQMLDDLQKRPHVLNE